MIEGPLEKNAWRILNHWEELLDSPASLSGKHHAGETMREHTKRCASVMRHLCDGLNISEGDRDMLIASATLHDIGRIVAAHPGEMDGLGYKYYPETGWSRHEDSMYKHGSIGADVISNFSIDRKEEIQEIISSHMGHWYPDEPQPTTQYQQLMVIADYMCTRKVGLFDYQGDRKT